PKPPVCRRLPLGAQLTCRMLTIATLRFPMPRFWRTRPVLETRAQAGDSIVLKWGEMTRPFYFRKGSSDEGVIDQIFAKRQYDLRRLRRAQELYAFARNRQTATGKRPLVVDAGANIGAS